MILALVGRRTTTRSMTYNKYKERLHDLRYLLSAHNNERVRGNFGKFPVDDGYEAIWNSGSNNVVAATNHKKKLLRIRRSSIYADAIVMQGYTVVKSDTLGPYREKRGRIEQKIVKEKTIKENYEKITALTKTGKVSVDLGEFESDRRSVYAELRARLPGHDSQAILRTITSTEPRKQSVRFTR